ncbi:MAG: hypothetical protein AAF713_12285 [Pseudomonadota bacterium]
MTYRALAIAAALLLSACSSRTFETHTAWSERLSSDIRPGMSLQEVTSIATEEGYYLLDGPAAAKRLDAWVKPGPDGRWVVLVAEYERPLCHEERKFYLQVDDFGVVRATDTSGQPSCS